MTASPQTDSSSRAGHGGAALPLSGVRVLDLSRVLAGPICGMSLGDLGAEVIKVEHPARGDDSRDWGLRIGKTETAYYNSANRNKRSLTLDLKQPQAVELLLQLATHCDVLIQNFKYGDAERLGIGYEQVKAVRPDIVYCSISGYDRHGSEAERPGYDLVVQAESGLMAINGEADRPPVKVGVAVVDMVTGLYATQAILAALYQRQAGGPGRHIEMALYDCGFMISAYYGLEALLMGRSLAPGEICLASLDTQGMLFLQLTDDTLMRFRAMNPAEVKW